MTPFHSQQRCTASFLLLNNRECHTLLDPQQCRSSWLPEASHPQHRISNVESLCSIKHPDILRLCQEVGLAGFESCSLKDLLKSSLRLSSSQSRSHSPAFLGSSCCSVQSARTQSSLGRCAKSTDQAEKQVCIFDTDLHNRTPQTHHLPLQACSASVAVPFDSTTHGLWAGEN